MSSIVSIFFIPETPMMFGAVLFVSGITVWALPKFRDVMGARDMYATRLRAAGQIDRAQKLEKETAQFRTRAPFYGKVLAAVGLVVLAFGLIHLRGK